MYFFYAVVAALFYVNTARTGSLGTRDFYLIVAVVVLSFLGVMDHIRRNGG